MTPQSKEGARSQQPIAIPYVQLASMNRRVHRPQTSMAPFRWNPLATRGLPGIKRCSCASSAAQIPLEDSAMVWIPDAIVEGGVDVFADDRGVARQAGEESPRPK